RRDGRRGVRGRGRPRHRRGRHPAQGRPRRRPAAGVAPLMEAPAWICLFTPLAGVAALTLAGSRISRQAAAWAGTLFAFVAFAAAVGELIGTLGENASARSHVYTLYTWAGSGTFRVPFSI